MTTKESNKPEEKKEDKTALEKTREKTALTQKNKMQSLADLLRSDDVKTKIIEGAPKYYNLDALIRVAISSIQRNPKLLECTQNSVMNALINCAYYGLVPESQTNEAHLVPFKDTCVLITGYQGLIKMATNSGVVSHVEVSHVYENDFFDYELGLDKRLKHKPAPTNPGEYIGSYAVVVYATGKKDFRYVTKEEGLDHGKRFSKTFSRGDSTWKTDTPSMVLKTAIRMIMKFIPKSPQSERLLIAIARDELLETKGPYFDIPIPSKEEITTPQPLKKENGKSEGSGEIDPETGEELPKDLFNDSETGTQD